MASSPRKKPSAVKKSAAARKPKTTVKARTPKKPVKPARKTTTAKKPAAPKPSVRKQVEAVNNPKPQTGETLFRVYVTISTRAPGITPYKIGAGYESGRFDVRNLRRGSTSTKEVAFGKETADGRWFRDPKEALTYLVSIYPDNLKKVLAQAAG